MTDQKWDGRPPGEAADVDGWHWLRVRDSGEAVPGSWNAMKGLWWWDGCEGNSVLAAREVEYLGPCMLPEDVRTAVSLARRHAMEKVADWLDRLTVTQEPWKLAAAIRATASAPIEN